MGRLRTVTSKKSYADKRSQSSDKSGKAARKSTKNDTCLSGLNSGLGPGLDLGTGQYLCPGVDWQNFQKLCRKVSDPPLDKIVRKVTHPHRKIKMNDPPPSLSLI